MPETFAPSIETLKKLPGTLTKLTVLLILATGTTAFAASPEAAQKAPGGVVSQEELCLEFNELKVEGGGGLSAATLVPKFLELSHAVDFVSLPKRLNKQIPFPDICTGRGTSLVASADLQILFVCEKNETYRYYDFGAGTCGFGKRSKGDRKTPIGSYQLGTPRKSGEGFGTFIPIAYPTAKQKKQGFSGADVGIHGPKTVNVGGMSIQLPFTSASYNWTAGCIAVSSYYLLDELVEFVGKHPGMQIHILEPSPEPPPQKDEPTLAPTSPTKPGSREVIKKKLTREEEREKAAEEAREVRKNAEARARS